jgi:hypothetical protein
MAGAGKDSERSGRKGISARDRRLNWRGSPMKAIDRVMRAYSSTRVLTEEQAVIARRELSRFIHDLMFDSPHQQAECEDETLKSE